MTGWYYLHVNGDLIYRGSPIDTASADIRESSFAKALWPFDPNDRETAWTICVEGLAAGAKPERIADLATKWNLSNEDADVYAERLGVVLQLDGNAWCATPSWFVNLHDSPAGFGDTKLEAMAELAKDLGYMPSKIWGHTFKSLLEGTAEVSK